jgi:hypothetical protein
MIAPRDKPEEIDELFRLGAIREAETNGIGYWRHPDYPGSRWSGAVNALAGLAGRPLPYPSDDGLPWAA